MRKRSFGDDEETSIRVSKKPEGRAATQPSVQNSNNEEVIHVENLVLCLFIIALTILAILNK